MGGFKDLSDLDEFIGGKAAKELPINGELISFPDRISAKTGALLIKVQSQNANAKTIFNEIDDEQWLEIQHEIVGDDAMEKLVELGVVGETYSHVIATLIVWHLQGREAAEEVWNKPGKARKRLTAQTRKRARKNSTR